MSGLKTFTEGVAEQIKEYLPPEYADMECQVIEQQKNNGVCQTGITFHIAEKRAAPTIYMEPYYQRICHGESRRDVMESIAEKITESRDIQNAFEKIELKDYSAFRPCLRAVLVNTRANWKMLTEMPHMEVEDLSVVFRAELSKPAHENGNWGLNVTNILMKRWGVGSEQLLEDAYRNMQKTNLPTLLDTRAAWGGTREGRAAGNLLNQPERVERDPYTMLYVLSNESGMYGAASLVCPGVMEKVCRLFPEGFYILPSSIHETLIVPKNANLPPRDLGRMVREVNRWEVSREDVLSDRVYEYDREKGKIRQVPESVERGKGMER